MRGKFIFEGCFSVTVVFCSHEAGLGVGDFHRFLQSRPLAVATRRIQRMRCVFWRPGRGFTVGVVFQDCSSVRCCTTSTVCADIRVLEGFHVFEFGEGSARGNGFASSNSCSAVLVCSHYSQPLIAHTCPSFPPCRPRRCSQH